MKWGSALFPQAGIVCFSFYVKIKARKVVDIAGYMCHNSGREGGVIMARTVAIGEQDFGKIIEKNYFYVDKTAFLKEWWENGDAVTLLTRPRRFGKTLAMNMLEYFFSNKYAGKKELFENLTIWKEKEYRELQGTYPVISLSFAGVKGGDYGTVREKICQLIVNLYADNSFLVKSGFLKDEDLVFFKNISAHMNDAAAAFSLCQLCRYLYGYYNKKVIILLDEYDSPMQEAYVNGYWGEMTDFVRGLFNSTFKTNPYLERAVMTGVTRVSKESVFSDLNNLAVVTTTSKKYADAFGFTEEEVFQALGEFRLQDKMKELKCWYDGYRFGDCGSIYNPWSVTQFLDEKEFSAYWANTSSNRLVAELIQKGSPHIKSVMENLMNGQPFEAVIDEQIVFDRLGYDENAVWSLLLAGGYLKVTDYKINRRGRREYVLDIVNLEVRQMFEDMFTGWFSVCSASYNDFIASLLRNDLKGMNVSVNKVALSVMSFFDSGGKPSEQAEPERFYHGFVLGLMVELAGRYKITSNRESGHGRYDVLLEPLKDKDDGILLEFKVFDAEGGEKNLRDTAKTAIRQIIEKRYAVTLEPKCGRNRIRIYGFAFRGKEVLIDGGYIGEFEELRKT